AGITGNLQTPDFWGPPSLSFSSGITGLNDGSSSFTRNQTTAFNTDMLFSRRGHSVQYGMDFRRQQFNYLSQQDARGTFTFTGTAPGTSTGNDFAGFLLGIPDTSSIAY